MERNHVGPITPAVLLALAVPAHAGNAANDLFVQRTPAEQALLLGAAVQMSGDACVGASVFFLGMGTQGISKDQAFWSVRCTNGRAYMVSIWPDAAGSMVVTECGALKARTGLDCFKSFSEQ